MELELEIDRVGTLGQGVGTAADGVVYFVPGTLPGERVRVKPHSFPGKKYQDAHLLEVVRASENRVAPGCPAFPECGGCDWLHWKYESQLEWKDRTVQHVLARVGIQPRRVDPIVRAEQVLGYRTRIQVSRQGQSLGFYRRGTQSVVDAPECRVARPELNRLMGEIREEPVPAEFRRREELYVDVLGVARRRSIDMYGQDFAQIHAGQNEKLKAMVRAHVVSASARMVVELYCGSGNLTESYVDRVERVWAADSSRHSIDRARTVLPSEWVQFHQGSVGRALRRRLPKDFEAACDTLIVDPPRQGIGEDFRDWVTPKLTNIVYVSCSPTSFSQDLCRIRDLFDLEHVQAIDMFPQTRHVELVAWLRRRC